MIYSDSSGFFSTGLDNDMDNYKSGEELNSVLRLIVKTTRVFATITFVS